MKLYLWTLGLVLAVLCTGCSSDVAGNSMETENSVAVQVLFADGTPAAKSIVKVYSENHLATVMDSAQSESVWLTDAQWLTDEDGYAVIPMRYLSLPGGKHPYFVEADADSVKGAVKNAEFAIGSPVVVTLQKASSLSGNILVGKIPEGSVAFGPEGDIYVGIRGLDYYVKADSKGFFEFPSLPAGEWDVVAYVVDSVRACYNGVNPGCEQMYIPFRVDSVAVKLDAGKKSEVKMKYEPVYHEVSSSSAPESSESGESAVSSSSVEVKNYILDNFEDGVGRWFVSHSKLAEGSLSSEEAGNGRSGLAAHFVCENTALENWVLMGTLLGNADEASVDMSGLDSIVFWARSETVDASVWVSLDVTKLANYESGKAWVKVQLNDAWTRYVVKPGDFLEAEEFPDGGNLGWDEVKSHITNISIFGGTGGDFWIDDIEIFEH